MPKTTTSARRTVASAACEGVALEAAVVRDSPRDQRVRQLHQQRTATARQQQRLAGDPPGYDRGPKSPQSASLSVNNPSFCTAAGVPTRSVSSYIRAVSLSAWRFPHDPFASHSYFYYSPSPLAGEGRVRGERQLCERTRVRRKRSSTTIPQWFHLSCSGVAVRLVGYVERSMYVVGTAGHVDHGKSTLVRPSPVSIPTGCRKRKSAA